MADGVWDMSEINSLAVDLGNAPERVVPLVNLALRKSISDMERDAKIFAPVDTGMMRASTTSTVMGLSAEMGPTVEYAPYVEEGTSDQAPQAFVGPAFDRNAPGFVAAVGIAGGEALF
jgi:HK97 gp10 family phage protein